MTLSSFIPSQASIPEETLMKEPSFKKQKMKKPVSGNKLVMGGPLYVSLALSTMTVHIQ